MHLTWRVDSCLLNMLISDQDFLTQTHSGVEFLMRRYIIFMISGMLLIATTSFAQLSTKSSWKSLDEGVRSSALGFADDYVSFLARARTELTTVQETRKLVETEGFQVLTESLSWRAGAKLYDVNRDRTVCVIVAGRRPISEGVRVIASHIDSPRLELKARPLYEKQGFAMFQTVYHGGIKKYQWVNVPLALTGRIDKTDGSTIWVDIGRHPDDPVFIIPDLAPHVDRDYRKRTASDVIKGEELDPLAGSMATDSVSVEKQVLEYLSQTYDMSEADFISSEFALVPAMDPRDVGFDRGLMVGYGHDDRLCAYASLRASVAVSQQWSTEYRARMR